MRLRLILRIICTPPDPSLSLSWSWDARGLDEPARDAAKDLDADEECAEADVDGRLDDIVEASSESAIQCAYVSVDRGCRGRI